MNKQEIQKIYEMLLSYEKNPNEETLENVYNIWHPYTLKKKLSEENNDIVVDESVEDPFPYQQFKDALFFKGVFHPKPFFCIMIEYCSEDWLQPSENNVLHIANIDQLDENDILLNLL